MTDGPFHISKILALDPLARHQGTEVIDPSWRTVEELALIRAPVLTARPNSIRSTLSALGLTEPRLQGKAWRYRVRLDGRPQAKEFALAIIIARLQKRWRKAPATELAEVRRRSESEARLVQALATGQLIIW